jgi:hypothetical protein
LEFATSVPHACQSGSLARARSSSPDLAEISIWFLAVTVHGRPKPDQTERYQHAEDLKMIIIFYVLTLPTATLAIIHQITALEVGGCEPQKRRNLFPFISRNVADSFDSLERSYPKLSHLSEWQS